MAWFSAICISGFSFILPAIEIVPIIPASEVIISIFMVPYIWNKIDWNFVFKLLIGIIIGSPIGLYLLKYLNLDTTHLSVCLLVIFFLTDIYAFILSSFAGIVDMIIIYRVIPLILVLPIGVFIGNKFFIKSKEENYRKVVFYFLIFISILGISRIISNI